MKHLPHSDTATEFLCLKYNKILYFIHDLFMTKL